MSKSTFDFLVDICYPIEESDFLLIDVAESTIDPTGALGAMMREKELGNNDNDDDDDDS